MNNPWDVRPRQPQGDSKPEPLLQAVGLALTRWESLEETRAAYFSTLLNSYNGAAASAFGMIQSSAGRSSMIAAAANHTLRANPLLDKLLDILRITERMVGRRNDIAHGIVRQHELITEAKKRKNFGYYLMPTTYNTLKLRVFNEHSAEELLDAVNREDLIQTTKYAYVAKDVNAYADEFLILNDKLKDLLLEISAHCRANAGWPQRKLV